MDEWDLGPPPQPSTQVPGRRAGDRPAATPDSDADAAHTEAGPAPLPEVAVSPAEGATPGARPGSRDSRPHGRLMRVFSTRSGTRVLAAWVVAALVLMALGAVIGLAVARSQNDRTAAELSRTRDELGVMQRALSQAEERNWNYYRENLALKAQIEAMGDGASASSTVPTEHGGTTVYGDGIHMVGEDIPAGTYDGVVVGTQGYWARLKATDGQVSSILANAVPRGPFVLTIIVSDKAVELRGVRLTAR